MLFWHLSRWLFLLVCCFRTREQEHGLHAKRPHDGDHHATHFKATVFRPYRSPRFATLANYVNHNRFKFCQHVVLFLFLKIPVTNGLADTKKKKIIIRKKEKKRKRSHSQFKVYFFHFMWLLFAWFFITSLAAYISIENSRRMEICSRWRFCHCFSFRSRTYYKY